MALNALWSTIRDYLGQQEYVAGTRRTGDSAFIAAHQSVVIPIQASLTRPANTTPYTAGDVEGAAAGNNFFSFDLTPFGVKSGLIVGARLIKQSLNNTGIRRRIMICDADLTTPPAADNAPYPLLWANRASRRGWVDFRGAPLASAEFGTGTDCTEWAGDLSNPQGIPVAPSDGVVRAWMIAVDAYTPGENSTVAVLELDLVI